MHQEIQIPMQQADIRQLRLYLLDMCQCGHMKVGPGDGRPQVGLGCSPPRTVVHVGLCQCHTFIHTQASVPLGIPCLLRSMDEGTPYWGVRVPLNDHRSTVSMQVCNTIHREICMISMAYQTPTEITQKKQCRENTRENYVKSRFPYVIFAYP